MLFRGLAHKNLDFFFSSFVGFFSFCCLNKPMATGKKKSSLNTLISYGRNSCTKRLRTHRNL